MLYTIRQSDLGKDNIKGIPLSRVLRNNPKVPFKTGAVVNLPTTLNAMGTTGDQKPVFGATFQGFPSGVQGTTGVSNTGQGVPNVFPGVIPNVLPQTIPPAQPQFQGVNTVLNPIGQPPQLPALVPFNAPRSTAPVAPQTTQVFSSVYEQGQRGLGSLRVQQPPVPTTRPAGATSPISVQQTPVPVPGAETFRGAYRGGTQTKPPGFLPGYPQPPNNDALRVPGLADEWKLSVDSGFAKATADKWERMKAQYSELGMTFEMFTPQELDWFRKFGKPMDIQYFNLMQQPVKKSGGAGMNSPSGGGSGRTGRGTAGYGDGYYSSSAGAFYGLVNWRL